MTATEELKPIDILLVDDSPTDTLLAREALEFSKLKNEVFAVADGIEALAFLRQEGKYQDAPRPDLILLDLNLPKKSGFEVLMEIKADDNLKRIPVVILTTSMEEADIVRAYGEHANCYICKPVDFQKFADTIKAIDGFWFAVVTLPKVN